MWWRVRTTVVLTANMVWYSVNLGDLCGSFLVDKKVQKWYYIICFHFHGELNGQSKTADILEEILQLGSPIWQDHNVSAT